MKNKLKRMNKIIKIKKRKNLYNIIHTYFIK